MTFLHRAEAATVYVDGSFQVPMQRIGDTDLWTVSVDIPNLAKAVLRYRFTTADPKEIVPGQLRERSYELWRGSNVPAEPTRVTTLSGRIVEHTIESKALEESRSLSVYLPPNHDAERSYPVIVMADGQSLEEYAPYLEALIVDGTVPATVLLGVHSGGYRGERGKPYDPSKDMRSLEYLTGYDRFIPDVDDSRFQAHEHFFLHEVQAWAQTHLSITKDRTQRVLFGFSNGGALAVSLGSRNPEHFGKILAFSVGWDPVVTTPEWDATAYPVFYLTAGTLEPGFLETTSHWADTLKKKGFTHVFHERVSGHDPVLWQEEFARAVIWALGDS
ncbi:MAG: alpha/beta hydrolase-fold protein [Acidobacteriota bacterium]